MTTKAKAVEAGAKTPDDKKKPHHPVTELFEFTLSTGDVIHAKFIENIPYKAFKLIAGLGDIEGQDFLFQSVMSDEDFQTFDDNVLIGELTIFLEAWQGESAITLGELRAS